MRWIKALRRPPELKSKVQLLAMLGLVVLITYVFQTGCIIKRVIRIDCPGCGMTRATLALLRGDVSGALGYHGMVWSLPLLLLLFLYDGQIFRAKWLNMLLWGVLGAGFAVNWLMKIL